MALQRDTKYPGRFTTATSAHPQGPFKNRTSSTSQDGSYLEKDWLNDWDGFFGSLLSAAGYDADGNVDEVGASQYFNAFRKVQAGIVGSARNLKCSITSASSTATFTADELIVETSLGGLKYQISNLSKTINITTTGAGGMDTGSAPASGYVAIYTILNPTTGATALLGVNATSAVVPEIYGGSNIPSGYTASSLLAVLPTNASSQFVVGYWDDRSFRRLSINALTTSSPVTSVTPLSISSIVPKNAKRVSVQVSTNETSAGYGVQILVYASSLGFDIVTALAATSGGTSQAVSIKEIRVIDIQTIYYKMANSNSGTFSIDIDGYTI